MQKKHASLILIVLIFLAACAPAPIKNVVQPLFAQLPKPPNGAPLAKGTYVGALTDSDILIGLVVQDGVAGVYLCDGKDVAEWFGGTVRDGKLDLTSPDKTRLEATVGDTIVGKVTLADGRALAFTAIAAVEGKTGLFRLVEKLNDDQAQVTGWVVTEKAQAGKVKIVRIKDGTSNITDGTSNTVK